MSQKWNQDAIKARVNGYLQTAIREFDYALGAMGGEQAGPELKAQADELDLVKAQVQAVMTKPGETPRT